MVFESGQRPVFSLRESAGWESRTHVSECDQGSVKEHDDAQQHEKGAERGQADLSYDCRWVRQLMVSPAFVVQLDPNWAAAVAPEKSDRVAGWVVSVTERGGGR